MTAAHAPSPDLPLVLVPRRHRDDRGWLAETYQARRLRDLGIACGFVQDNQSRSDRKGTLRGLHFQGPPAAQAKLIGVLAGSILDVVVDIRRGSPTYGKCVSVELSSDGGRQLYVPIGFAHGFVTLVDEVCVLYKVSDYYAPVHEGGIRWNDPDIGFVWPFADADILRSERDDRLLPLAALDSPFPYDAHPLTGLPTIDLA
jgi:dTDP-4-dehydrorhamnose 3,5-epimerase